jgi:hypothetical protein
MSGPLLQNVMDARRRRQIGAHYTSRRDVLKVAGPLFLDGLRADLRRCRCDRGRLAQLHERLARLRFLDPACGRGDFLAGAYRELRLLEIEVLEVLAGGRNFDIRSRPRVDMDAFFGIELRREAARAAAAAIRTVDRQMNVRLSEALGPWAVRPPSGRSPTIVCGNALRLDWAEILPPDRCGYVLGNPPFVGKHLMTPEQAEDMERVWGKTGGAGVLDYVTAWYRKAAEYIRGTRIAVGFLSTNSISQGEQAGALWNPLFERFGLKIHFAYRPFAWESTARGKARVHVVIVGFAAFDRGGKRIYGCEGGRPAGVAARNISPYLIEGADVAVVARPRPLCDVPACRYGSKPADGGFLIVEEAEREEFLAGNPGAEKHLRPLLCAQEYLDSVPRWCLWLAGAEAAEIGRMAGIRRRVEAVRKFRLASRKEATRAKAGAPAVFAEIRQPAGRFVVIPQHTSQARQYVPLGYFDSRFIVHNSCTAVPGATRFHFGVLSSAMHMAWVRVVGGRIKSDYRYSIQLVYNNYPWPQAPTAKQRRAVEAAAQTVLDARAALLQTGTTLAALYDPPSMRPKLAAAHAALDRAVDRCYRAEPFAGENQRVEFLFALYEKLAAQASA